MPHLRELLDLRDRMYGVLEWAAAHRDERPDLVPDPCNGGAVVPEWVLYERGLMLDHVNAERGEHARPLVEADEIARVERQAEGHADYALNFAFYCAELVYRPRRAPDPAKESDLAWVVEQLLERAGESAEDYTPTQATAVRCAREWLRKRKAGREQW